MNKVWDTLLSHWWGRGILVLLFPLFLALGAAGFVVYTVAWMVWSIIGLPIMFIMAGKVIDPEYGGNWLREHA